VKTVTTTTQTLAAAVCPSWCIVAPSPGGHSAHYGIAADWEGPGRRTVEVGIVRRGDGTGEVRVEVETYDRHGKTTGRTVTAYSPDEALAAALREGTGEHLAVALAAAVGMLGGQGAPQ
jgi:hypothetical protein